MSSTKVKIPELSPREYNLLMEAVKRYHANESAIATDKENDFKIQRDARANAVQLADLLEILS